jgi:hypothetical protein
MTKREFVRNLRTSFGNDIPPEYLGILCTHVSSAWTANHPPFLLFHLGSGLVFDYVYLFGHIAAPRAMHQSQRAEVLAQSPVSFTSLML